MAAYSEHTETYMVRQGVRNRIKQANNAGDWKTALKLKVEESELTKKIETLNKNEQREANQKNPN